MRVTFIIILVVIGILLGLPYWFGVNAEKEYGNIVEVLSESGNFTIIDTSYERGWFSSRAQTTFAISGGDGEVLRLHEEDTIYHGPIPFEPIFKGKASLIPVMAIINTTAALIPGTDSEYKEITGKLPPITLYTVLSLSGSGTSDITMPGIDSEPGEDGEYLVWSGLRGRVDFGPGFEDMTASIESGGLAIKSEDLDLSVSGVRVKSDITYEGGDYSLPIGSASLGVEEISLSSKDRETGEFDSLSVKNIEFAGSLEDVAGVLNSVISLGFDEVTIGKLTYGPGRLEFALRNIDRASWRNIQMLLQESREIADPEESRDFIAAELMKILPGLVRKSPEIEIAELSLKTREGSLEGHLIIAVDGSGLINPELASNPLFLIMAVTASAEISVTKTLLEEVMKGYNDEEIRDAIKSGGQKPLGDEEIGRLAERRAMDDILQLTSEDILVLEGDRYVLKAEYELGRIVINGKPLDLDSVIGQ